MAKHCTLRLAALLSAASLLAACAGNGIGLDQGGRPLAPGGTDNAPLTADFQSIQEHVFTPICTVCHAGASAPQGLRLDASNSYALLVGVPSTEVGSLLRVRPGDPDNSYLIQKLEGHAAVGAQMPFGGPYLAAATIAVIRQWISDGAAAAPVTTSLGFTLESVTPAAQDQLSVAPARIVMSFNTELDQTRIDASSVQLEAFDDGVTEAARPIAVNLRVPMGNPRALMIEPVQALAPGHYRVLLPPTPATGLFGIAGARLFRNASTGDSLALTEFEVSSPP